MAIQDFPQVWSTKTGEERTPHRCFLYFTNVHGQLVYYDAVYHKL